MSLWGRQNNCPSSSKYGQIKYLMITRLLNNGVRMVGDLTKVNSVLQDVQRQYYGDTNPFFFFFFGFTWLVSHLHE